MRERHRDEESIQFLENLLLDLRYAVRVLPKSPAFALVAFLTITLGIAANILVFGIFNAVVLRPLNVSDPYNLYQLRQEGWMSGHLLTTLIPRVSRLPEQEFYIQRHCGLLRLLDRRSADPRR